MEAFKKLIGVASGRKVTIVGAGGTLRSHGDQVREFIRSSNSLTIGINNISSFIVPDYHVWTNSARLAEFGRTINKSSHLIFGKNIKTKLVKKFWRGGYTLIDYVDKPGVPISYQKSKIRGCYRTAGCLAIMIAHLMKADNIYVVGMDGYTLHEQKDLSDNKEHHHLYGAGHTDNATWKVCLKKDRIVGDVLTNLRAYGIKFCILTPTKFKEFYSPILENNNG